MGDRTQPGIVDAGSFGRGLELPGVLRELRRADLPRPSCAGSPGGVATVNFRNTREPGGLRVE